MKLDRGLLLATGSLLILGLIMVCSASMPTAANKMGQPFFYSSRQFVFALIGLMAAWVVLSTQLSLWQRHAFKLFVFGIVLLVMVLIPGVGSQINGSSRWLRLGPVGLQVAEVIKLFAIIYMADYLHRNQGQLKESFFKIFAPLGLLAVAAFLLLIQPDLGSTVVIMTTVLAMLFLGGARLDVFAVLIVVMAIAFTLLVVFEPYRLKRLEGFVDPWADQFGSGFQLSQALIAFGQGDWFGVGLGSSMQKLFYLPEAHTDFLYSILSEELGFIGSISVLGLFMMLIWRSLAIGRAAELMGKVFNAQVAYGIGIWLGFQACVNMGVNMGVLPTKGLTLPLLSGGGSSLVVVCVSIALLFRVDIETRNPALSSTEVKK